MNKARGHAVMRFAYADPPYRGCAHRYAEKREVDQKALVSGLCREFPDGWALSLHSPSLKEILSYCPADVRVMAWVKPFCVFKPGVGIAYAWEPVIVRGGRRRSPEEPTVRDWIAAGITLKRGMVGVKPERFCVWLFEVLGMVPDDTLVDLFPGTGAVRRAWEAYRMSLLWAAGTAQYELEPVG